MKTIIIYCHDPVDTPPPGALEALTTAERISVFAWHVDIDPSVSLPFLMDRIDMEVMLNKLHEPCRIIFFGVKLGAWHSAKLAEKYGAEALLLNPPFDPAALLRKQDVHISICEQYEPINWKSTYGYCFSEDQDSPDAAEAKRALNAIGATYRENRTPQLPWKTLEEWLLALGRPDASLNE